ncbi:MAG: phosphoribosyltransferase [Candidatus Eremiobacteraeota bacterium]|nr:phosphoribosyltransferase [Candidatus Eremiobacteraeota bacterium]
MYFKNKRDAGKKLSNVLKEIVIETENALILAILRGGIEIGYEVSRELDIPLDIIIPKKLGAPGNPELAMGAVTGDGAVYLDQSLIKYLSISESFIKNEIEKKLEEIRKSERIYRGENPPVEIKGKTVLLVDDGIATGSTMTSAINALRNKKPARIIVAVPVAPRDAVIKMNEIADDILCLYAPEVFYSVGQFYEDFKQTTHEEVLNLLNYSSEGL